MLFLLYLLPRLSFVSVVFDFSASLIDVVPDPPILFAVDLMRMKKSGLLTDVIHALVLLRSLLRLSSVSVLFDFSASLNDVAPVSPMSFSVG